jgi:thiol-disulfide isomerase/thioredoxin
MKLEKITLISLLLALTFTNEVVLTNDNFFNKTHIKIFHQPEFKDHFGRIDNDWLIMYHTPWCGFCKKLAPTLK